MNVREVSQEEIQKMINEDRHGRTYYKIKKILEIKSYEIQSIILFCVSCLLVFANPKYEIILNYIFIYSCFTFFYTHAKLVTSRDNKYFLNQSFNKITICLIVLLTGFILTKPVGNETKYLLLIIHCIMILCIRYLFARSSSAIAFREQESKQKALKNRLGYLFRFIYWLLMKIDILVICCAVVSFLLNDISLTNALSSKMYLFVVHGLLTTMLLPIEQEHSYIDAIIMFILIYAGLFM